MRRTNAFEHFIEEFLVLASGAGHVVKYFPKVIADLGGLEPLCNGSPSSNGEQCT